MQTTRSNTAQAGGATSITLDASASATTDFYKNALIFLTGGTGAGQGRFCTAYNGTTKVATVGAWAVNPDNTSTFAITAFDSIPGATAPTAAAVATAVWTDLLSGSDFSTSASVGKLLKDNVNATIQSVLDTLGSPALGSVSQDIQNVFDVSQAVSIAVAGVATTLGTAGDGLTSLGDTRLAHLNADVNSLAPASTALSTATWTNAKAAFLTGDAYARLGAPAGASVSADIAATPASVWSVAIWGTKTAKQVMRWLAAAAFGKVTGSGSAYKDLKDGTTTILSVTDDGGGDRSVALTDPT